MKLGTETCSMMNALMARSLPGEAPKVGDGVTMLMWSDRHAGTIVKITKTQIHVQQDIAKRIDNNGMSESQTYEYTRDPNGSVYVFRKTKRGYRCEGRGLMIGERREYHDFSF